MRLVNDFRSVFAEGRECVYRFFTIFDMIYLTLLHKVICPGYLLRIVMKITYDRNCFVVYI